MLGLTQDYTVPFALALKATVFQVGLLSSIPSLLMALSQLAAPSLVEKAGSRKRVILPAVFLHALTWLPILLIPYLFQTERIWWLLGFITLSAILGSLGNPAWGSMMAELVPEKIRGRYFGLRGKICGLAMLLFFFIGGALLHFSAADIFFGFALLFGAAAVFRLFSCYFLSRMQEPTAGFEAGKRESGGVLSIFRDLRSSNLGRFITGVSLMNLATSMAGPFFAVYLLRDLKLDYLTYVIIISTYTVANFSFMTFWGRRADRAGNIIVLKVTSFLVPLIPLLWVGNHHIYYLIPVQMLSGFAWSGFNLSSANFIYDASVPERRMRYIAVFNALNGVSICFGALLGGFIGPHLPPVMGHNLLTLFLLSGLLRALVTFTFLRRLSEVRSVPETSLTGLIFGTPGTKKVNNKLSLLPELSLPFELGMQSIPQPLPVSQAYYYKPDDVPSRDPPG